MPITRQIAPVALVLALSGCISLGGGKPPPTLMTLSPGAVAPAGAAAAGKAEDALVVLAPDTDRRLAVTRVAVAVDPASIAYLKDAQWVDPPARLFRALLAETIRSKGTRLVFEDDETGATGRTRLAGRLLDMGYDGPGRAVVVRYDAVLARPGGAIDTRRFEARVSGVAPDARAVGPALNRAANDVARQVAEWVR